MTTVFSSFWQFIGWGVDAVACISLGGLSAILAYDCFERSDRKGFRGILWTILAVYLAIPTLAFAFMLVRTILTAIGVVH